MPNFSGLQPGFLGISISGQDRSTHNMVFFFAKSFIIGVTFPGQKLSYRVEEKYREVSALEDIQIIALYWDRNEDAIRETDIAYGSKLHGLAHRIVCNHQDAQECVNDTYLKTWDTIPPQRPNYFFAYLAKICRNLALSVLEWKSAAKRSGEVLSLSQEMEMCIPDPAYERRLEGEELGELLNRFLEGLSYENRVIFLRRYWYLDTIGEIAERYGISQSKVKTQLHRTRAKLHAFLDKEGIRV